jgi:hypothetical protein
MKRRLDEAVTTLEELYKKRVRLDTEIQAAQRAVHAAEDEDRLRRSIVLPFKAWAGIAADDAQAWKQVTDDQWLSCGFLDLCWYSPEGLSQEEIRIRQTERTLFRLQTTEGHTAILCNRCLIDCRAPMLDRLRERVQCDQLLIDPLDHSPEFRLQIILAALECYTTYWNGDEVEELTEDTKIYERLLREYATEHGIAF